MPFQAGKTRTCTWQYSGAGAAFSLNVTGHTWDEAIDKLDVTSTGHAGTQALIAGILRGDGSVRANLDSSSVVTNPNGLVRINAGQNGVLVFDFGYGTPYTVPAMITKVHHQSEVAGKCEYSFDVSLNKDASATVYARPTA